MAKFSKQSEAKLNELHVSLQAVLIEAIKIIAFVIICGYRGKDDQEKAFNDGKSKAHFGQSKHNFKPSLAVDLAPCPTNWNDIASFKKLADVILKVGNQHGIQLIWGGNWQSLKDYPHFELKT
jgi:peptidoglycan L-alanyl-D-glutamate endopeptidase CwlK